MRWLVVVVLGVLAPMAHAQTGAAPGRLDQVGLGAALATLGYQAREVRNESGTEYEIVLRPPDGRAITTRVGLSKDTTVVWLVAWLKKVPPGRTISGNAILDMLVANDAIGPTHFSYNEQSRWFFLNKPIANVDLTVDRLRAEIDHLAVTVVRTEALWDPDRWR